MKRIHSQSPHPTPSTSASKRARTAAAPAPASLQDLPQEVIDVVMDMAVRNHVPYQEVAAVSSAFRQTALSHARHALNTAPQRLANGAPCLTQEDWLQLSQAHRWLKKTDTSVDALGDQLQRLGPEALRASLEPWVAAHLNEANARRAAFRIVEAYRTGAPTLDLAILYLKTLPKEIGQLRALQELNIKGNQLTALPDSIGQLAALQKLDVGSNRLTTLPDSIGQLTALQKLDVNRNRLTTLPDSMGQLTALQLLDVHYNSLTTLFDSIGQLKALQMLRVSDNVMTMTLPDSIWQLKALKHFSVCYYVLITIFDNIEHLTALQKLYIDRVPLAGLPDGIRQRLGNKLQIRFT